MTCTAESSICTTGLAGHLITGILVQLLRQQYAGDNVQEDRLTNVLWRAMTENPLMEDPSRSTILIESVFRWDPRIIGTRPALLVKRGAQKQQIVGLTHNRLLTMGQPAEEEMAEWAYEHATPMQGTHTVFAISKESAQAELLAHESSGYLRQFGPVFEQEFSFLQFYLDNVGEVAQLQESDEHFAVPMQLSYAYYDRWKLVPVAPRFSGVSIQSEGVQ